MKLLKNGHRTGTCTQFLDNTVTQKLYHYFCHMNSHFFLNTREHKNNDFYYFTCNSNNCIDFYMTYIKPLPMDHHWEKIGNIKV